MSAVRRCRLMPRPAAVGCQTGGMANTTKQQRLRNTAEGFIAALVAVGFRGPFWSAWHQWEGAFYSAWRGWTPKDLNPRDFPKFKVGGSTDGRTSQARDMMFTLKSTSPFHAYDQEPLPTEPRGLSPEEYLEIWVDGAAPDEWKDLARAFLHKLDWNAVEA